MKGSTAIIVVVVLALVVLLGGCSVYNGLINKDERVKQGWSDIEAQLQRRADLIPNLVSTVKGYAAHEDKIFTEVAAARSRLLAAQTPATKAEANNEVTSALGRLLAISENYPNLKADQTFIRLQDELAGTENRIAVARTRYNQAVTAFNTAIRALPGNLFAGSLGLTRAEHYQATDTAAVQTPPQVAF